MVKSQLNPDKINYKEEQNIDDEDIGAESSLYEYKLFGKDIIIAIGKEKYTYSNYDIVYFPIYLIVNDLPQSKIGVFEIESKNMINILDEDGDVELNKGNIIFFSFVNSEFIASMIKKQINIPELQDNEIDKIEKNGIMTQDEIHEVEEIEEPDDNDDVTKMRLPTQNLSKHKSEKVLKDGIFVIDKNRKIPVLLMEETEEESNIVKSQYTESNRNTWIEKFMKNNQYDIVENESNGDCFFAVIRNAFEQIGHITTVEKLRALLAKEADDEVYQQYRTLYMNFLGELQSKEKEMKDIKKISVEMKKRESKTTSKEESKQIIEEAKKMIEKYNLLKLEKEDIKEMMEEFKFMENIDTFEKFKDFIQTPNYWADTWAVSTIEKILNIKIIILSNESFESGDLDSVLRCGQLNDDALERQGKFVPDFYIMTSYSGNHYELISYKNKRILKFSEIPYDIKSLVVNKCMERNAGPYYLIQDFRNLKSRLGLSPDEGSPMDSEEDDVNKYDLYDSDIVFEFHSKSNSHPKAGKGSGEKIPETKLTEFNVLNKDKVCSDWRKKLDDSWITPFTVDGHRWASVEHYVQGSQFKKGFPDFYLQFSLDSDSDISKDVSLAKAAGGKTGKLKDRVLRPKNVKIDADFYEIGPVNRLETERMKAIEAKFTQNLDLKKVLMETKNAKLVKFIRSSPPFVDEPIMRLRLQMRGNL